MRNNHIVTGLEKIAGIAQAKLLENDRFRDFIKGMDPEEIDSTIFQLNESVSAKVDCTACGNCCKTLMIVVSDAEADRLSTHLDQPREDFDNRYLEKGSNGMMIMNRMPCSFLSNNKCTVYEHRFEGCREFPALHLPGFSKRLFTTFMHYDRCPIIFNVVEQLKDATGFESNH